MPALSASSLIVEGKINGFNDTRLEVYRHNQAAIPSIVGSIVLEAAFSKAAYDSSIKTKVICVCLDIPIPNLVLPALFGSI